MSWRLNRWNNQETVISIKDKKGNGFPYGYVEITVS